MIQNSKFTVRLLEKIGAPLAAAIEAVPLKGENTEVEAAKIMAQMLGQAVQVSIALSTTMDITESEEQADSTRLALAAIAAPLLGDMYRQNERPLEEQDIKRIVKSLESVLAFSENFTPAAESATRLSTVGYDTPLFDKAQVSLVILQSLTPVMGAIAEFPFGQAETKLLKDVADKLQAHAEEIVKNANGDKGGDKLSEMVVLKSLAQIYADCHRNETVKLANNQDKERGELSLDPVWNAFETKMAMVEMLVGMRGTEEPAPQSASQPEEISVPASVDEGGEKSSAPAAAVAAGPMGFFTPGAQKAEEEKAIEEAEESEVTSAPTPVSEPAPVAEVAPEAPMAPEPVPQEEASSPEEESPDTNAKSGGGGPMSFFKKPDAETKSEDDSTE